MCGIAGLVINDGNASRRREPVERMIETLKRRGPDASGVEVWSNAVLGHRRLSIFDLSDAGRQPMLSPDRSIGIVFNGAIYNFRELRSELEQSGFQFKTETDTEVLIHGYRAWGIDELVKRLRGMFAIGLWDNDRQTLFLVRDRMGVKPLIYSVHDDEIAFASTVRALRAGNFVAEIDEQAVLEYLEFGFVTDERTIFENASKVPAAGIVEWSKGKLSSRIYWSPPEAAETTNLSWDAVLEETERLFLSAVEKRLFADVPVGALLSGGIDSSLVCWAITKLGGGVAAYTVGTPGDVADETVQASETAKQLGIPHQVLSFTPTTDEDALDELISAYGEPFACASALGMLRVSRAVASEAKVLLTGDGGDDVFLGYPEHKHFWMAQKLARGLPGAAHWVTTAALPFLPKVGPLRRAGSFFDYASGGLAAVTSIHDGLPFYQRFGILGERLSARTLPQRKWNRALDSARNLLPEFLNYDRHTRFVGEYLTKVDGGTMYHSLEARSPFLDQELWEFAAALPFEVRLRGGNLKAILRELARRRLGARVADAPKRGFTIPVQRWVAAHWLPRFESLMNDSILESEGWIRAGAVRQALQTAQRKQWAANQLWYIFVLETWMRRERENRRHSPATLEHRLDDRVSELSGVTS
jgi:asparagine synthase (glutamine-hydrolysing)